MSRAVYNTNYTCMRARPRVATAAAGGGGGAVQCNAMRPPPSQQHSHGCYTSECLCAPALEASSAPPPLTSHEITSAPLIGLRQNNG